MEVSVSVIIPFYSGTKWLIEAVESVFNQTNAPKEIIVINDGSRENITEFLDLYEDMIIYIYKENGGPATARNIGIDISTGDYIAFLDSDDLWLPLKLEKQVAIMKKYNCIWSHTSYETFDTEKEEPNTLKKVNVNNFNGMIYPKMLMSNNIATPCIMIKGDFLRNNINLRFNEKMRFGQDQYLWLSIAPGNKIVAINEIHTRVRMRGNNAALRARVQLRARAIIWQVLKKDKEAFMFTEIPKITKIAFKLSSISIKILEKFEKIIDNKLILELISGVLYFVPWVLFKFDYKRIAVY